MSKLIETVTLCKRIGALEIGFDQMKEAVQNNKVFLVVLASDISSKTEKEVAYVCNNAQVVLRKINLTLDEFWYLIGKRAGVIAITNKSFAEKLLTMIEQSTISMNNEKEDTQYGD